MNLLSHNYYFFEYINNKIYLYKTKIKSIIFDKINEKQIM